MPARLGQVLLVAAAAMLASTFQAAAQAVPPPTLEIRLMVDGSVQLDGKSYSDLNELELKLLEISHRVPQPLLLVRFPNVPYFRGYGIVALIVSSGLDTRVVTIWPVVLRSYPEPSGRDVEKYFEWPHKKRNQDTHSRKLGY
jgi:hypothetical protein